MARSPTVPKNFDDQLAALVSRIKSEGWDKKHGLDVKELDKDLQLQRGEKQKDAELEQAYKKFHLGFVADQAARYQRFMTAVSILRAAYRGQPAVVKSLAAFKRPVGPRTTKKKPNPEG